MRPYLARDRSAWRSKRPARGCFLLELVGIGFEPFDTAFRNELLLFILQENITSGIFHLWSRCKEY